MKASKSISLVQRQEGAASLVMFKDLKKKSLHILKSLLQQFLKELCHIAYTLLLTDTYKGFFKYMFSVFFPNYANSCFRFSI